MIMMMPLHTKQLFIVGSLIICLLGHLQEVSCGNSGTETAFVGTRGTQFVMRRGTSLEEEEPLYPNGFNAYWMLLWASFESDEMKGKVSVGLRQAKSLGLNVVRTWAFTDGPSSNPTFQYTPGVYNEAMFRGLDFVIAEAKKHGIYVILSLVNNEENMGGRRQYVEWAKQFGGQHHLTSDDDFYTNPVVKEYYKNHVKTVLTRMNTITGIAYRDDPIIFAWELMNEPRCLSDPSGKNLQAWITEMGAFVKSIDSKHLLEVGLEGFYGESMPGRKEYNPNEVRVGTDFIANNWVPTIDFATIHAYPDLWIPESDDEAQLTFMTSWIKSHVHDAVSVLGKPLLIAEFGKSISTAGGDNNSGLITKQERRERRDRLYTTVYNVIFEWAKAGGSCTGGLFWQLLLGNGAMDGLRDGYEVVVSETPSTAAIIAQHSVNMWNLKINSINSSATLDTSLDTSVRLRTQTVGLSSI